MLEASNTRFIGVDLAWNADRHQTGIAVARATASGAILETVSSGISSLEAAAAFVVEHSRRSAVVAVDAPLVVTNRSGQRPCETEIGRRFGRYEASAHTTNLGLYPDPSGVRFRRILEAAGFTECADPAAIQRCRNRCLFEVYPHPAQVVLFELDKTLKYKKGTLAQRRVALGEYGQRLRRLCDVVGFHVPSNLRWMFHLALDKMAAASLKRHDDTLDAVFCALLALRCWRFGATANECIGDSSTGYIINPKRISLVAPARPSGWKLKPRNMGQ
jgi:predicted RNase H-like nuclease